MKLPPQGNISRGALLRDGTILVVASVLVCVPFLVHDSLPLGSDVYSTNHYLQGFMKSFSEGDLYPRWTDQTNRFFGAPSFIMFVPLPYYLAGMTAWAAGSYVGGFKLFFLLICLLSALGCFLLVRELTGPGYAPPMAAALYLILPYHVLDMYQRFAISETVAFIFTPLILLFLGRDPLRRFSLIGAALSYAAIVYSHLPSAFMFSLFLGVWLPWTQRLDWRRLVPRGAALVCGLLLAAPALLPAMLEKDDANISWKREMPNGDYRRNFIFSDDVIPGLGFRDPVKPPVLRSAHAQLALAALAAWIVLAKRAPRRRREILALTGCSALVYFMQTPLSIPLWHLIPELPTIQFPWRFQSIQCLLASVLVGVAIGRAPGTGEGRKRPVPALVVLGVVVAINGLLGWQNAHLKPYQFSDSVAGRSEVEAWVEPAFTPVQFTGYRTFRQTAPRVRRAFFLEGEGSLKLEDWRSSGFSFSVESDAGGLVGVRSFWYPGWTARLDGAQVPIEIATEFAVKAVRVPPGAHTLSMSFDATPPRRAALWLAGLGAALGILLLVSPRIVGAGLPSDPD